MTPKEKAQKMYNIFDIIYTDKRKHDFIKKCATICIEQMILSHENWATEQDECIDYLTLVKNEINDL